MANSEEMDKANGGNLNVSFDGCRRKMDRGFLLDSNLKICRDMDISVPDMSSYVVYSRKESASSQTDAGTHMLTTASHVISALHVVYIHRDLLP